jgi:Ca2+-binding RTX toxin-like protein
MNFIALNGGNSGDLNCVDCSYGYFDDTVLVLDDFNYLDIRTFEGADVIDTSRTTFFYAERWIFSGSGNDIVRGGMGIDMVSDGSGDDTVMLGAGNDVAFLSTGNDILDGGTGHDTLDFSRLSTDGFSKADVCQIGLTINLSNLAAQDLGVFGKDTLAGFEAVIGADGRDKLTGNTSSNEFWGMNGNDYLSGESGSDVLWGGAGMDVLVGGSGADTLDGGGADGAMDRYRYRAVSDSNAATGQTDTINDFDRGGTATSDRIDLSAMDGDLSRSGNQAFIWRGTSAFTNDSRGEVRVEVRDGMQVAREQFFEEESLVNSFLVILIDTDSDPQAEMEIYVSSMEMLFRSDFIL